LSKKDRVILDLPRKLTLAIDRAVDRDVYATNRRAFILSAIHAKLNEVDPSTVRMEEHEGSTDKHHVKTGNDIETDDGYILPGGNTTLMTGKSKEESKKESQLCKDLIRFFRYENRPISIAEIKKLFEKSFSKELIEDQLNVLEEEGVLYKLKQDMYCLSR